MTRAADTRLAVLKVLGGQSPGYFIFPNASAFVAAGLDPGDVVEALEKLHTEGKLERELISVEATDPASDGGVEHVPGGYRLAPAVNQGRPEDQPKQRRRTKMRTETTPEPEPEPTTPEPEPEPDDPEGDE